MGAWGLFTLQDDREDVLEERTRWLVGSASVERRNTWDTTWISEEASKK